MRILFLNQYFPPDPAPTGILLQEVAEALAAAGHEIVYAGSGQDYRGGQRNAGRVRRELEGLWRLFLRAMEVGKVNVVVSGTSPPLLVLIGAIVARLRGARHYHWLFDMYPELATALGEIREGRAVKIFAAAARWAYLRADGVVALDGDMAERLKGYGLRSEIIAPWVFKSLLEARAALDMTSKKAGNAERIWLYSGNLGRAHEWMTLLEAQRIIEAERGEWRLVFQGGGPARQAAEDAAKEMGLKRCEWRPYAPEGELAESLMSADVLVVTQKPETRGLLWPSKLALVTSLPRGILWVGPRDGAIGRWLRGMARAGVFERGDAKGVARWIMGTDWRSTEAVTDAGAARADGIGRWAEIVSGENAG